jgi:hypothetical protein
MNTETTTRGTHQGMIWLAAIFLFAGSPWALAEPGQRMYRVTIQNLTDGQAFTPPLAITHGAMTQLFEVGLPASPEIQAIAENGNGGPLKDHLSSMPHVNIMEGMTGPLVPSPDPTSTGFGHAVTLSVPGDHEANHLSVIAMLICTNDGFTGLNSVPLPHQGSSVFLTAGMDAGTEVNTEDYADLVPPCQGLFGVDSGIPGTGMSNAALAEGGVITHHMGIQGVGHLDSERHDWSNPVGKITVTLTDPNAQRFETDLSGAGEVPLVYSFAQGAVSFELHDDNQALHYRIDAHQISGVTAAHIHAGLPGENGPAIAVLAGPMPATGMVNGPLVEGTVYEADLINGFENNFSGLVTALRDGSLYVNVHTADNPSGEIRGQIGSIPIGQ